MVAIRLVCDRCGKRTPERVFDGASARSEVEGERIKAYVLGWRRTQLGGDGKKRDLCLGCYRYTKEGGK